MKRAYLVEMNLGQLYSETRVAVNSNVPLIKVNRIDGELITPNEIVNSVKEG